MTFPLTVCMTLTVSVQLALGEDLHLTLLHTNDVHSRFTQTNKFGGPCSEEDAQKNKCFGGFARLHHKVNEIRSTHKNVLYVSGGDYYQGTVWYTIHKWRIISDLLNRLNHTALAFGNHEFDDGIAGLLPYVDAATFPITSANIDGSEEPEFLARQENGKIQKSVVVTADNGVKIGIIGYTTLETPDISNPGKLKFLNIVDSINREATRLHDEEGVKILIALGHAGFDVDQEIAAGVPLIDVVVGGHTNTFLYTGTPPSVEVPLKEYPFMVTQKSGRKVPCVQAYAYGKYLGYLNLTVDGDGEVVQAVGNPILLDDKVKQDPKMLKKVNIWGKKVSEKTKMKVGSTKVFLNGQQEECRMRECTLGDAVVDAMVYAYHNWSDVKLGIMNGGGLRGSIDDQARGGSILMEDVLQVMPFQNTIDILEITGKTLKEAFEFGVAGYDPMGHHLAGKFLQVSGIKVVYDLKKPEGEQVKSLQVLCDGCEKREYGEVNETGIYKVVVPTYIATGGDGFYVLRDNAISHTEAGILDSDMFVEYLKVKSPITQEIEGRIKFEN